MIEEANNKIIPTAIYNGQHGKELDLEAIALYVATGFFFENDTFWKDAKWNELDFNHQPWTYQPRDISLETAVDEFANLFHQIVEDQTAEGKVILPLSGGLDSRTLAVALAHLGKEPYSYSYQFEGSFEEANYGKEIAKTLNWTFDKYIIPPGYLWNQIEESAQVNGCFSEFTHARQIAVAEEISAKGDVWLLGHWGDVLFDDMGVPGDLNQAGQMTMLKKKVLKKGGVELGKDLWEHWKLPGSFEDTLTKRIDAMLNRIDIDDANARIRAFKSLYWATRWTSTNLVYFSRFKPIALPYYDDRMCQFIMTVPEKYLAKRQIQIEYIKKYNPDLARIPWQEKAPYNLYNYSKHLSKQHYPYLIKNKIKRTVNEKIFGKKLIQRNWEIQFKGEENELHLKQWLFKNDTFSKLVGEQIPTKYYDLFANEDGVYWSHPLSMLLTLGLFTSIQEAND